MLRVGLLLAFTFCLSASTAQACLWDRETNAREVEFKHQYNPPGTEPASPAQGTEPSLNLPGWVMLSMGGVLGTAALGFGIGVGIAQTRKSA